MNNINEIGKSEFIGRLERLVDKLSFTEVEIKKSVKKQSKIKGTLVLEMRELVKVLFTKDVYKSDSELSFAEQFDVFYGSSLGGQAKLKVEKRVARKSRDIKDRLLEYRAKYQDSSFPERADDMIENHKIEIESYNDLDYLILGDEYKESKLEAVYNRLSFEDYVFLTENYSSLKFLFSKLTKKDRSEAWKVREYLDDLVENSYWKERGYTVITPWDVVEHHSENHKAVADLNEKVDELKAKIRNFKVAHSALQDDKSYAEPTKNEVEKEIRTELEKGLERSNESTIRHNINSLIEFYKKNEVPAQSQKLIEKLAFMTINRVFIEKLDQELFSVSAKKRKVSTVIFQLKNSSSYNSGYSSTIIDSLEQLLSDQHVRSKSYTAWIDGFKYTIFNLDGSFNSYSEKSLLVSIISSMLLNDKKSIIDRATARIVFSKLVESEIALYQDEVKSFMDKNISELTNCEVPDMQEKFMKDISRLQDKVIFNIEQEVDSLLNDIEIEEAKQNTTDLLNEEFMSYDTPDSGFSEITKAKD